VVRSGNAFVQPSGPAHPLIHTGKRDFIVPVFADNPPAYGTGYPGSKK
jgi:hypothetical protein